MNKTAEPCRQVAAIGPHLTCSLLSFATEESTAPLRRSFAPALLGY
jgi:hypothetical protein